jgi:hypothetical protein
MVSVCCGASLAPVILILLPDTLTAPALVLV